MRRVMVLVKERGRPASRNKTGSWHSERYGNKKTPERRDGVRISAFDHWDQSTPRG